jgi:hypothetical protein
MRLRFGFLQKLIWIQLLLRLLKSIYKKIYTSRTVYIKVSKMFYFLSLALIRFEIVANMIKKIYTLFYTVWHTFKQEKQLFNFNVLIFRVGAASRYFSGLVSTKKARFLAVATLLNATYNHRFQMSKIGGKSVLCIVRNISLFAF